MLCNVCGVTLSLDVNLQVGYTCLCVNHKKKTHIASVVLGFTLRIFWILCGLQGRIHFELHHHCHDNGMCIYYKVMQSVVIIIIILLSPHAGFFWHI